MKVTDTLTLLDVVESYTKKVKEFHEWFTESFRLMYKTELTELYALQKLWSQGIEPAKNTSELKQEDPSD